MVSEPEKNKHFTKSLKINQQPTQIQAENLLEFV